MAHAEARAAVRLDRLLAAEGQALREGRYGLLDDLARRKALLVDSLALTPDGAALLARALPRLARNQRLLAAAIEGLRQAQALISRPPPALRTYGPDGQPGPADPTRERTLRRL